MFNIAIVNKILRHCHSWFARQQCSGESMYMCRLARAFALHTQSRDLEESSEQTIVLDLCWIHQHGSLIETILHMI